VAIAGATAIAIAAKIARITRDADTLTSPEESLFGIDVSRSYHVTGRMSDSVSQFTCIRQSP